MQFSRKQNGTNERQLRGLRTRDLQDNFPGVKAFVAGATGYTGREVVRELRARGIETVAHVRPDSRSLPQWRARFEKLGATVDTTPWQPDEMSATLGQHQPALTFGCLGTTRARAKAETRQGGNSSYETVDYGLTTLLLHATSSGKFIYISSLGVSANTRSAYLAVRWRVESEIKASGKPYVIARPPIITGSDRGEFRLGERSAAWVSNALLDMGALVGLRSLHDRFASLTGPQLAHALVDAALDTSCTNVILEADQLRRLAQP